MKKESDILRELRNVQYSVPDRDFLWIQPGVPRVDKKNQRQLEKLNIVGLREQVKSFHESFKGGERKIGDENKVRPGLMSITEMKEFRAKVARYASRENADPSLQALDGIVKYIDLKNSGLAQGKQRPSKTRCIKWDMPFRLKGDLVFSIPPGFFQYMRTT